jgi:hypothetical protein
VSGREVPNPTAYVLNPAKSRPFRPETRMQFDLKRVAEYIRGADTDELLDRVTVYREGMEPAALDLMEGELDRRGVTREDIAAHDAKQREFAILLPDGTAMRCSFCNRPAIVQARRWHRLFGRIPIFPKVFAYCAFHSEPKQKIRSEEGEGDSDANLSDDRAS